MQDFSADAAINWGPRTLTGKVPGSCTWAEQEAPVRLWLADGTDLWSGTLTQDPWRERGEYHIRAEGHAAEIAASDTRMFYRRDGAEGWVEREAEPHEIGDADKYDLLLKPSMMKWKMGNAGSDSFAAGDAAGYLIWLEGTTITRYSVFCDPAAAYAAFDLKTQRFTGPTGTRTLIATHSLNVASATYANDISSAEDALMFHVEANTSAASSTRRSVKLSQIKIYGRTTDDAFGASDVVADVGTDAGLDTSRVQSNTLAVLPLDWTEDHTALLDYMAELTDWHWTVDASGITFGPFEETITGHLAHDIVGTLEPMRRYNRVVVPFHALSGAYREVSASPVTDPFPGQEVTYYAGVLEHPQSDSTLASNVAAALVEYHAAKRVAGRVTIGRVTSAQGEPLSGLHVKPGMLLDIPDSGLAPQRLHAVTYRGTDRGYEVTADINSDFSVPRVIAALRSQRRGNRRRRR